MEWWASISYTITSEFSDITDLEDATRVSSRLLIASILGGLLGYERERRHKAAGLRTHMLVALGAALFVLVPVQAGMSLEDISRVIQGLATGIGFLGAGTILKGDSAEDVKGLTTAAGIWLTAAIGVAVGLGHEATAVMSTLLALVIFALMPRLERHTALRAARKRRHTDQSR
ncbi:MULTISPECIES: MgtC/SapB family protein [Stutzerimonas stutzeri subgroup]|jgi:putative Mg2+ transporter-C (MgtC) family protein|uniref:Protein MgtC n=1 Tax=Stutzerimonas stutzeri NF13 TaxID=1212548 RepID=M2VGJ3_STUST|nr:MULTISPECIES: MgtC/SapB family protein [Stutzerimonas stutzeri subgroup]MBS69316.1 methyltransferase [Pseudomonas sp.]WOF80412.1 MgtC/SapB family protein [Pseudomonas sp. FeN3W]EMD98788.1 Mg2+ transporter [Stutzerimonas stutzeri NF13]MBK3881775.1 MgtC/SapB family protein [Stutzerimonas stutzeri]MCQ4289917.1 MgtC/SapB family protein [Stutzerimonas stutzeri]|tara:strand:- start:1683 stop:2201 length:519 start_codon:yes stop_codon:yes gene_type:complete